MTRDEEIGLSWKVLDWVIDQGEKAHNSGEDHDRIGPLLEEITLVCNPVRTDELPFVTERKTGKLTLPSKRCVLLKPDDKGRFKLPVLRLKHDERNIIRYEVGLYMLDRRDGDDGSPVAIGLRFEEPKGADGLHSFFHAQLCRQFHGATALFPGCPEWLPDQHPAIPVDADGPLSLLIALLKSLYGNTFLRELRNTDLWEDLRGAADDGGSLRRLLAVGFQVPSHSAPFCRPRPPDLHRRTRALLNVAGCDRVQRRTVNR